MEDKSPKKLLTPSSGSVLANRLGGADERIEQRARDEHAATRSAARARMPKLQFNVRATQETRDLIDALAEHYNKPLSDVIALAAEALAKATPGFKRVKG